MASKYDSTQTLRFSIPQNLRGKVESDAADAAAGHASPGGGALGGHDGGGHTDSDYHQLFQSVYDGALIVDLNGVILDVNYRAQGFLLYHRDPLCGMNVGQFISGADENLIPDLLARLAGRRFALIDAYCSRQDGSLFPAEIAVSYLPFHGQRCLCFFVRDITLRRQTEDMLRTEHCAILNAANGIAIADLSAKMEYVNPAGLHMWNYTDMDEVRGMDFMEFFGNEEIADAVMDAVYHGQSWNGECQVMRPDGSSFHVQISASGNRDADDEFVGMVFSFLDITNRKHAEEAQHLARLELETANRELASKNSQFEQELALARNVHLGFLPKHYPYGDRVNFAHYYHACEVMGGDLFDVFTVAPNQVGMFMADVSGHGVSAALISGLLKMGFYSLRAPTAATGGRADLDLLHPERILGMLNKVLTRELLQDKYITVVYGVLNLDFNSCRYAIAGHPAPILFNREAGTATRCKSRIGPAVGFGDDFEYPMNEIFLKPGDKLLFYTDGITEALNAESVEFGLDRLLSVISREGKTTADNVVVAIRDAVEGHRGHSPVSDDMSLMVAGIRD